MCPHFLNICMYLVWSSEIIIALYTAYALRINKIFFSYRILNNYVEFFKNILMVMLSGHHRKETLLLRRYRLRWCSDRPIQSLAIWWLSVWVLSKKFPMKCDKHFSVLLIFITVHSNFTTKTKATYRHLGPRWACCYQWFFVKVYRASYCAYVQSASP